jgi:hypothetical protein
MATYCNTKSIVNPLSPCPYFTFALSLAPPEEHRDGVATLAPPRGRAGAAVAPPARAGVARSASGTVLRDRSFHICASSLTTCTHPT